MDPVAFLQNEWKVIVQTPVTFVVGGLIIFGIAYAWARHQFSDRLASAEARLALKEDQIKAYSEKLDGASPDEARERIEALENEVRALRPVYLTIKQKTSLKEALSGSSYRAHINSDGAESNAVQYARAFSTLLMEIGWKVDHHNNPFERAHDHIPGSTVIITIAAENPNALSNAELLLKAALRSADVPFNIAKLTRKHHPPDPPDVEMMITR